MIIRIFKLFSLFIVLQMLNAFDCVAFELRYLHPAEADINYNLEITRRNQVTSLDINRHIDSNDGSSIQITTDFSNGKVVRGGIPTLLNDLNGPVSTTVMDDHGVVSSVQPLSSFQATLNSLNLTLKRDIMSMLGISSFPQGDLSVGDSWTKTASKGTTNATFTYTIKQENVSEAGYNSVVIAEIVSDFVVDEKTEIPEVKKTSYTKGKVSIRGNLYFDINTGRIVRLDQTITSLALTTMVDFNGKPTISTSDVMVTARLMIL